MIMAVIFASTLGVRAADDSRRKDALAMLSQMRVKRLTTQVALTEEQQKKVLALYDDEAKKIAVVQTNEDLDINQKYEKRVVIQKETDGKLTPLLTAEQNVKYEAYKAKTTPKKKPAAKPAAAPAPPKP